MGNGYLTAMQLTWQVHVGLYDRPVCLKVEKGVCLAMMEMIYIAGLTRSELGQVYRPSVDP
jgi:hypothetical protein